MTRVDFYISKNNHPDDRAKLACRLAEKAYQMKHRIYVHTDDRQQAEQLDQLMWVFRDGSFIPHCLADDPLGRDHVHDTFGGRHDHGPAAAGTPGR